MAQSSAGKANTLIDDLLKDADSDVELDEQLDDTDHMPMAPGRRTAISVTIKGGDDVNASKQTISVASVLEEEDPDDDDVPVEVEEKQPSASLAALVSVKPELPKVTTMQSPVPNPRSATSSPGVSAKNSVSAAAPAREKSMDLSTIADDEPEFLEDFPEPPDRESVSRHAVSMTTFEARQSRIMNLNVLSSIQLPNQIDMPVDDEKATGLDAILRGDTEDVPDDGNHHDISHLLVEDKEDSDFLNDTFNASADLAKLDGKQIDEQ
jgi:hypothetical protein